MFLLKVFIIEFKHALIWREAEIYICIFQKSFYFPSFKPLSSVSLKLSKDKFMRTHLQEMFIVYDLQNAFKQV